MQQVMKTLGDYIKVQSYAELDKQENIFNSGIIDSIGFVNLIGFISKNYDIQNLSKSAAKKEMVDIVGCLCTTLDRLANRIEIGSPAVGDVVAIKNSGAYGLTASPVLFLGHATPREILIKDGRASVNRESKDITQFN